MDPCDYRSNAAIQEQIDLVAKITTERLEINVKTINF